MITMPVASSVLASVEDINQEPVTSSTKSATRTLAQLLCKKDKSPLPVNHAEEVDRQMQLYLADSTIATEADPLQWWSMSGSHYNLLSQLAKKYLCLCATSVTSERLFSVAGSIVTSRRTSLKPHTVNNLVFLSCNLSKQIVNEDSDSEGE